jgi:hypothetical protein
MPTDPPIQPNEDGTCSNTCPQYDYRPHRPKDRCRIESVDEDADWFAFHKNICPVLFERQRAEIRAMRERVMEWWNNDFIRQEDETRELRIALGGRKCGECGGKTHHPHDRAYYGPCPACDGTGVAFKEE